MPLEKFHYRNELMGCVLLRSMENVQLVGITVSMTLTTDYAHIYIHCLRERLHSMTMAVV